jgi:hypothetical protein
LRLQLVVRQLLLLLLQQLAAVTARQQSYQEALQQISRLRC